MSKLILGDINISPTRISELINDSTFATLENTEDYLDDVVVSGYYTKAEIDNNYYTKSEIDALLGDIDTILDSIINGNTSTKLINTLRLTVSSSKQIVNADTLTVPLTWTYPVASDVSLLTDDGLIFMTFDKGTQEYSYTSYMPATTTGFTPSPTEDDTYIYEVILV